MGVTDIAGGVPGWVYALLAALVVLGIRRLRTREQPLVIALMPALAFSIWSVIGAAQFAAVAGTWPALGAWLGGAAIGGIATSLFPEARGERLGNGRVRIPGSRLPLLLYMIVFLAKFACGMWAAIDPPNAGVATSIGIAIGAAMMARLVIGVVRWQRPAVIGVAAD